jgi:hypothetical protein
VVSGFCERPTMDPSCSSPFASPLPQREGQGEGIRWPSLAFDCRLTASPRDPLRERLLLFSLRREGEGGGQWVSGSAPMGPSRSSPCASPLLQGEGQGEGIRWPSLAFDCRLTASPRDPLRERLLLFPLRREGEGGGQWVSGSAPMCPSRSSSCASPLLQGEGQGEVIRWPSLAFDCRLTASPRDPLRERGSG